MNLNELKNNTSLENYNDSCICNNDAYPCFQNPYNQTCKLDSYVLKTCLSPNNSLEVTCGQLDTLKLGSSQKSIEPNVKNNTITKVFTHNVNHNCQFQHATFLGLNSAQYIFLALSIVAVTSLINILCSFACGKLTLKNQEILRSVSLKTSCISDKVDTIQEKVYDTQEKGPSNFNIYLNFNKETQTQEEDIQNTQRTQDNTKYFQKKLYRHESNSSGDESNYYTSRFSLPCDGEYKLLETQSRTKSIENQVFETLSGLNQTKTKQKKGTDKSAHLRIKNPVDALDIESGSVPCSFKVNQAFCQDTDNSSKKSIDDNAPSELFNRYLSSLDRSSCTSTNSTESLESRKGTNSPQTTQLTFITELKGRQQEIAKALAGSIQNSEHKHKSHKSKKQESQA